MACTVMPPAPPVPAPPAPSPAPAPPPPPLPIPPGNPPSPPSPPPSVVLDLQNSFFSGYGDPTLAEVLASNGVVFSWLYTGSRSVGIRLVLQNTGSTPAPAVIQVSPSQPTLQQISPSEIQNVVVPANNYLNVDYIYSPQVDGTLQLYISTGGVTNTFNIAFAQVGP